MDCVARMRRRPAARPPALRAWCTAWCALAQGGNKGGTHGKGQLMDCESRTRNRHAAEPPARLAGAPLGAHQPIGGSWAAHRARTSSWISWRARSAGEQRDHGHGLLVRLQVHTRATGPRGQHAWQGRTHGLRDARMRRRPAERPPGRPASAPPCTHSPRRATRAAHTARASSWLA